MEPEDRRFVWGQRIGFGLLTALLVAWLVAASLAYRSDVANAALFYASPQAFLPAYGTSQVQVHSVRPTVSGLASLLPPRFSFDVHVDATIRGRRVRDGKATVDFSPGGLGWSQVETQ